MKIRKVAESIIDGLNNLENRTKTIQKMAYSYRAMQIEIVLNHLRHLTSRSSRAAKAREFNSFHPVHDNRNPFKGSGE